MKTIVLIASATTLLLQTTFAQIQVPATSNPWLAGMPSGTTAPGGDSAPAESPVLITGVPVTGGADFYFSASGAVSVDPDQGLYPLHGPDGEASDINSYSPAPINGIANVNVPLEGLIGVFLSATQPNLNPAPPSLDFSSPASQNYLSLSPELQQPFFIGDGLTSSGIQQQVIAPAGATRLYLGIMDPEGYFNNVGSFTVNVSAVPEPNMAFAAAIVMSALGICGIRRKSLPTV